MDLIKQESVRVRFRSAAALEALVSRGAGRIASVSAGVAMLAVLSTECFAQTQSTVSGETTESAVTITEAAAETTASAVADEDVETTGAAEGAVAADLHVVLLGEVVGANAENSSKGPFPDLGGIAATALGGQVTDLTTAGLTMEALANIVGQDVTGESDVALVFTGFTDDEAGTEEAKQRQALSQIIATLRSKNEKMRVFLVPAATAVGAITSANMRLAATEGNATFVPIGTEVGGQPYVDAIEGVRAELAISTEPAADLSEPASTVVIQGGQLRQEAEALSPSEAASYEEKKANLQQELERVAGQAGEAIMTLPSLEDTATTGFIDSASTGTTGTVRKRGAQATDANIKMKSLPAVKAFRPQIPVPRNDVDVKEPALSR